ncbi:MAG: biotin--[Oscillospiraceae bacterium]|nr:biotin--[acetyl-CoA-carboxylase] ligase [Oscillospiraceae bacterium]
MDYIIKKFDTVSSTNDIAKEQAENGAAEGTVIIADAQEKGRGRLGRSFLSPNGGLYMSVILRPESFEAAVSITTKAAVAAALAIEKCIGEDVSIKWVNDIYYKNKKVCGILTESVFEVEKPKYAVWGIGVNLKTAPQELSDIAGGIGDVDRDILAKCILDEFFGGTHSVFDEYSKRDMLKGKTVTVFRSGKAQYSALASEITANFGLKLIKDNGTEEILQSGEVSVRL